MKNQRKVAVKQLLNLKRWQNIFLHLVLHWVTSKQFTIRLQQLAIVPYPGKLPSLLSAKSFNGLTS
jgi:hypothetical protein